jgi:ankyrin repeat protein
VGGRRDWWPHSLVVQMAGVRASTEWLWAAVSARDVGGVKAALRDGADVNARQDGDSSALHMLADSASINELTKSFQTIEIFPGLPMPLAPRRKLPEDNTAAVLDVLIAAGANVNLARKSGDTPLHAAATLSSVHMLRGLVAAGADVNAASGNGDTPLLKAAEEGNEAATLLLLRAGARVNQANTKGRTPLIAAAKGDSVAVVHALLAAGASVNLANSTGITPLYNAAMSGRVDVVVALLSAGADVHAASADGGATPLYAASWKGHLEVVRALLAFRADCNVPCIGGFTPLFAASTNGHLPVIKALLGAGADPTIATADGHTPLQVVCTGKGAVVTHRDDICSLLVARASGSSATFADARSANDVAAAALERGFVIVRSLGERAIGAAYLVRGTPATAAIVAAGTSAVVQITPRPIPADAVAATLRHLDALREVRGGVVAGRL